MKKILATVSALACAATCAFGLVACSDDSAKKNHTEEQWQAAMSTKISEVKSLHISQSYSDVNSDGTTKYMGSMDFSLYSDSVNTYYYLDSADKDDEHYKMYLLKKGDRYYQSFNNGKCAEEISAQDFTTSSKGFDGGAVESAQLFIDLLKTRYGELEMSGSGSFGYKEDGVEKSVEYSGYSAENMEFTVTQGKETYVGTAAMIDVGLDNETGVLTNAYVRDLLLEDEKSGDKQLLSLSYENNYGVLDFDLPQLPEFVGKTFNIVNAEVDNDDYENIVTGIMLANDEKTVTFKADGTFAGDISVNDSSITTYTWEDDLGYITMTNKSPDLPDVEGGLEYDEEDGEYKLMLEMTIELKENGVTTDTVVLTLELRYVNEAA